MGAKQKESHRNEAHHHVPFNYHGNDKRMVESAEINGRRTKSISDVRLDTIDAGHLFHITHEAQLLAMIDAELRARLAGPDRFR